MLNNKELRNKAWELYHDMEGCIPDLADLDEIWNDPLTLRDFLGDRIYRSCNSLSTEDDKLEAMYLVDDLYQISHEDSNQKI